MSRTAEEIFASFGWKKDRFTEEEWVRLLGAAQAYRDQFKRGKKAVGVDECFQEYVDVWVKEYPSLGFGGVSGRMIKLIIAQSRKWLKAGGKEDNRERVVGVWRYVINYVKQSNHFCNNKPLTTWNGQYLSIIAEISSGKRANRKLSRADETREFLENIRGGSR